MATFALGADPRQPFVALYTPEPGGRIGAQPAGPPQVQAYAVSDRATSVGTLTANGGNKSTKAFASFPAQRNEQSSGGFDWFETFHVVPRAFDFGNLLSDQSSPLELFSAFRRLTKEWTTFVNNAGIGVSIGGLPGLPTFVDPLSGIQMTLDVSATGEPIVDGSIDFTFVGVGAISVPVEIIRLVLWGLEPELPYSERLAFLSDVFRSKDGTEKRHALRKNPRQGWDYDYVIQEGVEAQILENLLFDFQARNFGVPVWFEDSALTADVSAGATTISVNATAYRDYRVGGFAVIFTDQGTFDVLQIDAGGVAPTSLTFNSPTVNAYLSGTQVFPLATCRAQASIEGSRYPVGLRTASIRFNVIDNDVDLADLSPFSTYKSKLLLDVGNSMIRGNVGHGFAQELVRIDGETGLVFQDSSWDRHKRSHLFTMRAEGRQAVWEMRGMIHALRGKVVSFYVPTDSDDLVVASNLLSASNVMDVENVGYAQFVRNRQPKSDIRITFVDGSPPLLRGITASASTSPTVDQLTVDGFWPSTITPAEIARVEYVEKLRMDSDEIKIEYDRSGHRARMVAPVQAVFE